MFNKIQHISLKISEFKQKGLEIEEKSEQEERIDKIINNYDEKMKKENEKMVNEKSKYEVNKNLKVFEQDKINTIVKEKVQLLFGDQD
mmetsp:Transcript_34674/g.33860  ORF Transcript_34674/g.33860 Transcript_34674/m.33860 type:complete len:88 (-) Transcript_34674:151-414(-)